MYMYRIDLHSFSSDIFSQCNVKIYGDNMECTCLAQVESACSIALQAVDSVREESEEDAISKSDLLQFVTEVCIVNECMSCVIQSCNSNNARMV